MFCIVSCLTGMIRNEEEHKHSASTGDYKLRLIALEGLISLSVKKKNIN
jgi:hypothetical protein